MASKAHGQQNRVWRDRDGHTVVHVARADVGKNITLTESGGDAVRIDHGERVEFRLDYTLRDEDRRRDDWRLEMDLAVDGEDTTPRIERIDDNPDVKDAYSGSVAKTIRFNAPGDYQVRVGVRADHDVSDWSSRKRQRHEMRGQAVTIPVHVD